MSEQKIHALYSLHDLPDNGNIIPFVTQPGQECEAMLMDMGDLIEDPKTRAVAIEELRAALHNIGARLVGPKS